MRQYLSKYGPTLALLILGSAASAQEATIPTTAQLTPRQGVDLGIADDETFRRPNSWSEMNAPGKSTSFAQQHGLLPTERILAPDFSGPASRPAMSIAWRNAAQVEEVEVRVRNLGTEPGEGRVSVNVLDETGVVLLHLEPPDELRTIRLPAFAMGGREGKVLRMHASRELNNLIDRFDNERKRYNVQAIVETTSGADANSFDNKKTKSWNVSHAVRPRERTIFNYVFQNHEKDPVQVKWLFERTPYPTGWKIDGVPSSADPFMLAPGQQVRGTLSMDAPDEIAEAAFVEARISLVRVDDGSIFQQHEWFQVYDSTPPTVTDYRMVIMGDRRVGIQALVADKGSGVLEATGVTTEYSTDGGLTWSRVAHNYKVGNFIIPTLFEAIIGPFAANTDLQLRFTAKDTAGNTTSIIPDDAVAVLAPPRAEKLVDFAYIFPRTQANPIYTLQPGAVNIGQIAAQYVDSIVANTRGPDQTARLTTALSGLNLAPDARRSFETAAERLRSEPETAPAAEKVLEALRALPAPSAGPAEGTVTRAEIQRIDAPASRLLKMSTIGTKIP